MAVQTGVTAASAAAGGNSAFSALLADRLRALTLDAGAHGFAWDARADSAIATPGFKNLFGIGDDESLDSAAIAARLHPDDAPRVLARQGKMLADGGSLVDEFRIVRPDGVVRWIRAEAVAMVAADGAVVGLAGINRDVSAAKGLPDATVGEEALSPGPLMGGADLAQLVALGRALPALLWAANRDGFVQWYNERWHAYCGSTPENMAGYGFQSVIHPDDVQRVLAEWVAGVASGGEFEIIYRLRAADGSYSPFLARAAPARDAGGAISGWTGISIDIGAERAASEKLVAANAELERTAAEREAILDQIGEGVIITDADGAIQFVNQAASDLHGVSALGVEPADYAQTYGLFDLAGHPFPVEELPLTRAVRDEQATRDTQWIIRRADGSEVLAVGNARPVRDAAGRKFAAVLTIRDDTERNAAQRALEQALADKDMLLYEVNHRVKNSLQLVTSLLGMQARKSTQPELQAALAEASDRIAVIAALHEALYAAGAHDSVDICAVLVDLVTRSIRAFAADGSIAFECHTRDPITLPVDRAIPLALIVSELVTNALKYAYPGERSGRLQLSVERLDDRRVRIAIADDGVGLPDDATLAKSSGIGMRVVDAFIRQLRAKVQIDRTPPGTRVAITLPL